MTPEPSRLSPGEPLLVSSPVPGTDIPAWLILLAAEIAQRISGTEFPAFLEQAVFRPLKMDHSSLRRDSGGSRSRP